MNKDYKIWQVIGASSVGTMIEWYDFYIFGSLTTVIAPLFYPKGNNTLALIAYLSTFAVGFVVRPFGALFFVAAFRGACFFVVTIKKGMRDEG